MIFYFRQHWNDPRLSFDGNGIDTLTFGDFSKIWKPDTFFVNEKTGHTKDEFIKIHKFAMLSEVSDGYTANEIEYIWKGGDSVGVSTDAILISSFQLMGHTRKSEYIQLSTGNYSRLSVEFELKRLSSMHFTQVFIPCNMIVILSWISFWLTRKAAQVRLVICALTMLLLTLFVTFMSFQMPRTAYIKAIDVYTGICMTFVFAALVEFVYISNTTSDDDDDLKCSSSKIDKIFRYGYAGLYIVFNIIYWIVY